MQPEDYPEQDELAEFARPYAEEVVRRAVGIEGEDVLFGSDPYQSVGIHQAPDPNGSVFAFIHGGGWTNGYKEWNNFMAPAYTSHGVTFVSIGYRLAPRLIFPAGLDDCAMGVSWIYKNISDYGGDPSRIFLGGHSAGGHYSSLLAVKRDWQEKLGLPSDVIRGCIPVSGVYRFGENSGLSQSPRFLGAVNSGNDVAASSILFVNGVACPFLMAHGENDFPHLIVQAEEMETALRASGTNIERVSLAGCDHLEAHYATGELSGDWVNKVLNFISI